MTVHPSQAPDFTESILAKLARPTWPVLDALGMGRSELEDVVFYRNAMWAEASLIINRALGGAEREFLALGDREAFPLVMDVIFTGKTHAEAASGVCLPEDLAQRHREYADAQVLSTFLLNYPALHYRISGLAQASRAASERNRARKSGRGA
ncbi:MULTISPECIES: hypothetical protein [unclassified Leucobacter]|uniref:hypothetical protein n=1 Tax=unclassified Leucobacter TaxID=2621730 RepID=UPI003019CCCB